MNDNEEMQKRGKCEENKEGGKKEKEIRENKGTGGTVARCYKGQVGSRWQKWR